MLSANQYQARWYVSLFKEVDIAPLILFRILFGFLLFCHCVQFMGKGINEYFVQPSFVFTSPGFTFLQGLRGEIMYYYFAAMAFFGLMIMVGLFYRFSMIAFTLLWQVAYLVQVANYNNHFYLILLLCYLMIFMPANQYCSMDVAFTPTIKTRSCPQWIYYLFIVQVMILYFYAGFNKLNADWLSGAVYKTNAGFKKPFPFIGSLYFNPFFKYLIIWGGLIFDLLICPILLIKRFRRFGFILACLFHLLNVYLFDIGIFPYLSIALFIFFFDPPEISKIFFNNKKTYLHSPLAPSHFVKREWIVFTVGVYLLIQVLLPLRAYLYKGNTYWTEDGYRLSWRMMMRTKGGIVHFTVKDSAAKKTWVNVEKELTPSQQKILAISPDMIWQFAQKLSKDYADKGFNVQVYASSWVRLNDHPAKPFVDSTTDLAKTKLNTFKSTKWILPFHDDANNLPLTTRPHY